MNQKVNCDDLPGHLAEICRGTYVRSSGRPYTIVERRKIVGMRLRKSPDTLILPDAPEPTGRHWSGIGDRLQEIIVREVGSKTPCSECKQEILKLNQMVPSEVLAGIEPLARRIVSRAKTSAPKWWQRWGATLRPGLAADRVMSWIREACGTPVAESIVLPINRIVVAIRTARRDEPTLSRTLQSLLAAGFENPILFGEPDSPDDVDVRWSEHQRSFRGFVRHAQWLLDNNDGEWFLLCEDDVLFARGMADRLRAMKMTNEIVTLFKPHGLALPSGDLVPVSDVNGSLAVLVRRAELSKIVQSTTVKTWRKADCVDKLLTRAAREIGSPILSPSRSWVQHIGEKSVCQPAKWALNSLTHRMRFASDFDGTTNLNQAGLVTLITPTGDRQDAFRLCERWMANQRYTGELQWIVIDDGRFPTTCSMDQEYIRRIRGPEWHSLSANLRAAIPQIRGRHVLIIEDDDYYSPDYVSMMVAQLQHADLVGEVGAKYYYLPQKSWRHRKSETWASLCRTGFNRNVIHTLAGAANGTHPSVDLRLWQRWKGSRQSWVDESGTFRGCVGIKGMGGRPSRGHRPARDAVHDAGWQTLRKWIGDDWETYREMAEAMVPTGPGGRCKLNDE